LHPKRSAVVDAGATFVTPGRFEVFKTPRHEVRSIGNNDLATPMDPQQNVTAEQIIAGYEQLITRAHAKGLKFMAARCRHLKELSTLDTTRRKRRQGGRPLINGSATAARSTPSSTSTPPYASRVIPRGCFRPTTLATI
jgi:hypothetical protein